MVTFDKSNIKGLRTDIEDALKTVGEKHGLVFKLGTIRFSASEFRSKLDCKIVPNSDEEKSAVQKHAEMQDKMDRHQWGMNCHLWGFSPDDFGKEFRSPTRNGWARFKITGCKPRNRTYPVIAEKISGHNRGKSFKFSPNAINLLED